MELHHFEVMGLRTANYIALLNTPDKISTRSLSLGKRSFHSFTSARYAASTCCWIALSDLKMTLFMLFQSYQQRIAMKVPKCFWGY